MYYYKKIEKLLIDIILKSGYKYLQKTINE